MDNFENFVELTSNRRSIREFQNRPLDRQVLNEVLDAAKWAPTWCNTQPYFLAIAEGEKKDRISAAIIEAFRASQSAGKPNFLSKIKKKIFGKKTFSGDYNTAFDYPGKFGEARAKSGTALYKSMGIERADQQARDKQLIANYKSFGAPTAIYLFAHDSMREYGFLDSGIFLQNLMLAASARGLGTCAQGSLAKWADVIRKEFEIPEGYKFLCGVSIGYPSDAPVNSFNPGRRPLDIQF
jgi:nitroreductase